MSFGPNRLSTGHTLRFRLMAWNAAVVVITALVTLLGVREGVRYTLVHELDQLLSEDASEIELALADFTGANSLELRDQLDRKDAGHAQHKWFVQLLNSQGKTLYQSQHAPPALPRLPLRPGTPQSIASCRIFERAAAEVTIRVGSSMELIQADVQRIDRLVALAVGIVFFIAPLSGYWLAGRATAPLNEMIATLAEVHPSRLDQRLRIRGTGDELDRLSHAFNSLLDRLASYLQEHRDLLANSAHELRTPLAAIRSSIEVALSKQRNLPDYTSLLSEIIDESSSLELLVNQLLLLSETEAERLIVNATPVRFDELVERAVDMFSGVAEYRDVRLGCSPLPTMSLAGNSHHLRQVIYNLLDNALKFTDPGGQVNVVLTQVGQWAQLTVCDSGIGIRPEDLPHVFDRFFRCQRGAKEAEVKGTGLGLSICRSIVHAHGGSIEVTSRVGTGTRFNVLLPLSS